MITNTNYISSWKSKGLSAESIKTPTTSDNSLTPALSYYGTKTRVKFTGSCLKQSKISYTHGKVVNIYIVYELNKIYTKTTPTLVNCLFGAVSLTKMLILISINILDTELDLIEEDFIYYVMKHLVEI